MAERLRRLIESLDKHDCVFFDVKSRCGLHHRTCLGCGHHLKPIIGITEKSEYFRYVTSSQLAGRSLAVSILALLISALMLAIKLVELLK